MHVFFSHNMSNFFVDFLQNDYFYNESSCFLLSASFKIYSKKINIHYSQEKNPKAWKLSNRWNQFETNIYVQ